MRTYLYISYKCNCNCFFCASDETNIVEKNNEFSLEDAKEFLLGSPNRERLVISGGEPTIHKDFLEIVRFAKLHYKHISLMTNGIKFSDMDFLKATVDAGVDIISIPFYSPNEQEHNIMVGNSRAYENVVKGLHNLNDLIRTKHFYVQIKLLLAKFTYKLIPESIDYIAKQFPNLKYVSLYGFHIGSKALNHIEECLINYNDSRFYNDKAIQKLLEHGMRFYICQIPFCAFSANVCELLIRQKRYISSETSYLKRPDSGICLQPSPVYAPKECSLCHLYEYCFKIYGKNAMSFDYGVRPMFINLQYM